jgi:hypothetical protein
MKLNDLFEDVFAKNNELFAAVNPGTKPRSSTAISISTNKSGLGRQTGTTRGVPVYYAFAYVPSEIPGGSTELLKSFKGKGPFKFPNDRRHRFLSDTCVYMAAELRKHNLKPDIIVTPQSSSDLTMEFANALGDALGISARKIGAFKKTSNINIPDDKKAAISEVQKRFIDMDYFNEKFHGTEEDKQVALNSLTSSIIRLIKKNGMIVAKEIDKRMLKFVKNIVEPDLQDDTVLLYKKVLVIDDILSSGGTMSDLFRAAKELGASDVFGCTLFARTSINGTT